MSRSAYELLRMHMVPDFISVIGGVATALADTFMTVRTEVGVGFKLCGRGQPQTVRVQERRPHVAATRERRWQQQTQ